MLDSIKTFMLEYNQTKGVLSKQNTGNLQVPGYPAHAGGVQTVERETKENGGVKPGDLFL